MSEQIFPEWIRTFTRDWRGLVARKASREERCELIRTTEREQNLDDDTLVNLFMAYVDSPEGKREAVL